MVLVWGMEEGALFTGRSGEWGPDGGEAHQPVGSVLKQSESRGGPEAWLELCSGDMRLWRAEGSGVGSLVYVLQLAWRLLWAAVGQVCLDR